MNLLKKIFISLSFAATLLLPQVATAQTAAETDQCTKLREQITKAGGAGILEDLSAYCTTGAVYTKFINFALYAISIVAVIAIIYGGYLYMTAGANEAQRKKGRQVLTWAIIGLVVVLAAAVLVNIVVRLLVENRFV